MVPDYEKGEWYHVQMEGGHFWMPSYQFDKEPSVKDIEAFCGLPYFSHEKVSGWGARMYDAGDGDCTDWVVFDTQDEAKAYIHRNRDLLTAPPTNTPLRDIHEEVQDPEGNYVVFSAAAWADARAKLKEAGLYEQVKATLSDLTMLDIKITPE